MPTVPVSSSGGGASAITQIADSTLGGTGTFDFTGIAASFSQLSLYFSGRATNAASTQVRLTLNGDSGANYYFQDVNAINVAVAGAATVGSTFLTVGVIPGTGDTAGRAGGFVLTIPNYGGSTYHKDVISHTFSSASALAAGQEYDALCGLWANTAAITRITLVPAAGATFEAGTRATLYGLT